MLRVNSLMQSHRFPEYEFRLGMETIRQRVGSITGLRISGSGGIRTGRIISLDSMVGEG